MITKERGEEEDDEGDGCDTVEGEELCLTEVVLVVRGRRIRVDRYMLKHLRLIQNIFQFLNRARLALVSKFFKALFSHQFEVLMDIFCLKKHCLLTGNNYIIEIMLTNKNLK